MVESITEKAYSLVQPINGNQRYNQNSDQWFNQYGRNTTTTMFRRRKACVVGSSALGPSVRRVIIVVDSDASSMLNSRMTVERPEL